mmetsp:Transcript_18418/g.8583  ORF Transcript_18418/g.8583 Transcript_18418/m.8583 type:complete len:98 (+) Transcript_18418:84-377(+)
MIKTMNESLKIPHFTYMDDMYMDKLMELRNNLKHLVSPLKLTYMPFFMKAMSLATLSYPYVNSSWTTDTSYTVHGSHNVSLAMDSPHGLIVPNIKDV